MRLDDIVASSSIDDRRGGGGGGGFPGGGGGLGIGMVIVLTIAGWAFGINPAILIGGAEVLTGGGPSRASVERSAPPGQSGAPSDQMGQFVARVLGSTEVVWEEQFPAQQGAPYAKPQLVLFSGATRSACGGADASMGPFYCPNDKKVYLDTSFFNEMRTRFRVQGDFAQAYVVAHEVGHHVQNQIGILGRSRQMQERLSRREANAVSVRVELMADCLAGVWAFHADRKYRILEQGDVEEALAAATAIGDDRLQKQAQGYAVPDSFTHGTSEQRVRWFTTGLKGGQMRACNTFGQGAI